MTGNKHNYEGISGDKGEPNPGHYWRRMHTDWRFWVGAVFMFAALAIYVLTGDLSWVPPQPSACDPTGYAIASLRSNGRSGYFSNPASLRIEEIHSVGYRQYSCRKRVFQCVVFLNSQHCSN